MNSKSVQRNYLILTLLNTLAGSLIWGINTLFLLDAGLSNTEAFAANAFFTAGMMVFEIPTGVVADTLGRRTSFMMGSATLALSTFLYLALWKYEFHFWGWAVVSIILGLGFTFFTGAVEAWLVDALSATGFSGALEDVFAKGQMVAGAAMLSGSVLGGYIAQVSDLGVPYVIRCVLLLISFVTAFFIMKDLGFSPRKSKKIGFEMKRIFQASIEGGIKVPAVRWVMLSSPFIMGVGFFGFYAAQPYLLELYGDSKAYSIAGLAAALMASSQIAGGFLGPKLRKFFARRTSFLILSLIVTSFTLIAIGLSDSFWVAITAFAFWGIFGAIAQPIKQAYLNKCISSEQRATVLSFDGLLGSTGGVIIQPPLGRAADIWGYGTSFVMSGSLQLLALPLFVFARVQKSRADIIEGK